MIQHQAPHILRRDQLQSYATKGRDNRWMLIKFQSSTTKNAFCDFFPSSIWIVSFQRENCFLREFFSAVSLSD